jgi:hypothetical protein
VLTAHVHGWHALSFGSAHIRSHGRAPDLFGRRIHT